MNELHMLPEQIGDEMKRCHERKHRGIIAPVTFVHAEAEEDVYAC